MGIYLKLNANTLDFSLVHEEDYEDSFNMLRDSVEGTIERVGWIEKFDRKGIDIWLNDEGKIRGLKPSLFVLNKSNKVVEVFCGNILFSRYDGPETVPLQEGDIEYILNQILVGNRPNGESILAIRMD